MQAQLIEKIKAAIKRVVAKYGEPKPGMGSWLIRPNRGQFARFGKTREGKWYFMRGHRLPESYDDDYETIICGCPYQGQSHFCTRVEASSLDELLTKIH